MKPILVINSGSSSLKYQVIDTDGELSLLSGAIERVSDHGSALREMAAHLEDSGIEPVAVAIGPVLQGLNKPVNDLSRGALVPDIVNTIAITAIQAASR